MPFKPKPKIDTSGIPANILALAKRQRHPARGLCGCGRPAFLNANGTYVCDKCEEKKRHRISDPVKSFGIAGSNYHRVTGKYVNPSHLEQPYMTARDRVKSNIAREINRYGKY